MLDLKIYDEDQYDLVPVPLPGRLMIFAGATGLMCRRSDGTFAAYPAGGGGGSGAGEVTSLTMLAHAGYTSIPIPSGEGVTLAWDASNGEFVVRQQDGAVVTLMDGTTIFSAPNGEHE